MSKKFKLFSKLGSNIIDHPKIKYNRLKKKKWILLKKRSPQLLSKYGSLLKAKQILKAYYGNPTEKKFSSLYKKAKILKGNTGINFLKLLEKRLNTVLFRMGFANSYEEINQFVTHKHILVNGIYVKSPSYLLKSGDIISVHPKSFSFIQKRITDSFLNKLNSKNIEEIKTTKNISKLIKENKLLFSPNYIEINYNILEGTLIETPSIETLIYPNKIDLPKIIQYYEYIRKI